MDATRVMTTAALAVAMASLFAPPVVGLMSSPPTRPSSGLEVATIVQPGESMSLAQPGAVAPPSCEPATPTLAARIPRSQTPRS